MTQPPGKPGSNTGLGADAAGGGGGIDAAVLRAAFNAFKKRWKSTRLDQESRLGGHRPTSSGRASDIAGLQPPMEFPMPVWQELARQGRIRDMRGGFYAMPLPPKPERKF